MNTAYRIDDEPRPSKLAHLAVKPLWPLLGLMLAGSWLAWPWFALNSLAVGSPTMRKELVWLATAIVGSLLLIAAILYLDKQHILVDNRHAKYALLMLTLWKLGTGYAIFTLQSRTLELYEYYGGILRNGLIVVLAAAFFGRRLIGDAIDSTPLRLLLG